MIARSPFPVHSATGAEKDDFRIAAEALRPDRSRFDPVLREAAAALDSNRVGVAAALLRDFLIRHPHDVNALYLAAEAASRQGRNADTELLLARCSALAPGFTAARF